MTTIFNLIKSGETMDVEFKSDRNKLSDNDIVEAVVCLSNRPGNASGWLLIGVEDDGKITGVQPRHNGKTDATRIQALIASRTGPSISVRVEVVQIDGKDILTIEIPPSRNPIGTADGRYIRRVTGSDGKPSCAPYHFHEMQSRQADMGLMDYSAAVVQGCVWKDLDPLEFERFRRMIRESRGAGDHALLDLSDIELAKALGAVEANHEVTGIRVLGLLLFGKEEVLRKFLPVHEIAWQVLEGTSVRANEFMRYPILRVMEELMPRFRALNTEREISDGMMRIPVPNYPERAFREAVANAFIHRDYMRLGSVHIQWHSDKLQISNPGGFPEGVTMNNILVTQPHPRNPLLADALKRVGMVERTARGVDTIFFEQLRNGRPAPTYEQSTNTDVVLVLPGGEANMGFVQFVIEEKKAGKDLDLDQLMILNLLWIERRIDTARVASVMQKPESEARAKLQKLVEAGYIEARGERKGRSFHLSVAVYKRFGGETAYLRQKGPEPKQQEALILDYIAKNGRVTRAQTIELCKLGPLQAKYILRKMVQDGKLVPKGTRRGAYYENRP